MRKRDIVTLLDYTYWADRQILSVAAEVPLEHFTAPSALTFRDLRGTLVHTLGVERSWRLRLRGESRESWDSSLLDDAYPTVAALADHWRQDEAAMRAWLHELDDDQLTRVVDIGTSDAFPLWYYLVHIVTHSAQQRRDAAILLTNLGQPPPELEFLYYADWLRDSATSSDVG